MKVAIYVRVSTDEQAKEGFSLNAQLEKLKAFCYSQSWDIYKEYREEGKSAKDIERPQLKNLLSNMNKFDVILVYKLDRLSRSVADINYLLNTFEKNKVSFKSATEPYDTTTAQGKLLINIFASLAQFEREQLAERTVMGMQRKHEEGKRNGGRSPYGYSFDDERNLIVNPEESKWVKFIFDQFGTKGRRAIAKALNQKGIKSRTDHLWTGPMIDYIVRNPVYYGALRWNYRKKTGQRTYDEVVVMANHETIIDKELFDSIKKTRKERQGKGFKGHAIYPYTGIAKCARCGHNLIGSKRKRADGTEYRFYKCTGRFTYNICNLPVISEKTLDMEFIEKLEYTPIDVEIPQEEDINTAEIEEELKRIKNKVERIKELFLEGDIEKREYRNKTDELKEKESELIQTLETTNEILNPTAVKDMIHNIKENWLEIDQEDKKQVIQTLFDKIVIEVILACQGGQGKHSVIEIKDISFK